MNFDMAAKHHPQALIAYLAKRIIKKIPNE
jgi:hypothetical protein